MVEHNLDVIRVGGSIPSARTNFWFTPMDTIAIKNLVVHGVHGLMSHEQHQSQRFSFDITIEIPSKSYADRIGETVDYGKVKRVVVEVVHGPHIGLIEVMAELLIEKIFSVDEMIKRVTVSISKLDIWNDGTPSVTLTRERS